MKCMLTERILIERLILKQSDNNFEIEYYQEYYRCWSGFKSVSGKEYVSAKTLNVENIVTFTVRYCNKVNEINTKDFRISYKGKYYNIIYINDYNNEHNFVDFKCEVISNE